MTKDTRSNKKIRQFAEAWVNLAYLHCGKILLAALVLFALAIVPIKTKLKINSDLASLLPQSTPSVLALQESYTRFGSTDKFQIGIEAKNPVIIAELQQKIAAAIRKNWKDDAINTQFRRDNSFFEDRALLYLPVEHLENLLDNLSDLKRELNQSYNPLSECLIDCADDKNPDEQKERIWFDASIPQELGLPDEAASAFSSFITKKESVETGKEAFDPQRNLPDSLKANLIGQNRNGTWVGLVVVKLVKPSTDLTFVEHILKRADTLIAEVRKTAPSEGHLRIQVEGTYEGLKEVEALKLDGIISFFISFALIIGLTTWFFRSWKAPLLLLSQILFACTLMLSLTALTYGQLNPFTLFVAAIILGMGIDFSIHMMGAVQRYREETGDLKTALIETMVHLAYPMFLAALTTVAGLLTLLIADFTGFYEFGVIASVGIALSFASAILGMPMLLLFFGGLPRFRPRSFFPESWSEKHIATLLKKSAVTLLILSLLLAVFIPQAGFEHDFKKLRKPKGKDEQAIHTGVANQSNRKSSQPAAIMGDNRRELDILHDSLMQRLHGEKDPLLRSFLTLKSFVPPEEKQEERLEIIEEIGDLISARVFEQADGEDARMVRKLKNLVDVETFSPEDIPKWALDLLKEKNGNYGTIGFIYGNYPSWDANKVAEFQDKYGNWVIEGNRLRIFSSQFILSDVIRSVKNDSIKMAGFISIVLLLTLVIALRHPGKIAVAVVTLALGTLFTLDWMGLLTLFFGNPKVGIYNVIVIPTILGVGIDSTIHLLIAWQNPALKGLRQLYDTTGRMVIASSLTTAAGFLGVLFITHKGMRTIGQLSVLGIVATLVMALVMTPWLAKFWISQKDTEQ